MATFGELLLLYRKEKGLTQKALGNKCVPSFTGNYIFLLESGRKIAPPEESVLAIAKVLALSQEKTKKLLDSAISERLSHTFVKNRKIEEVESVILCLAQNFSKEEILRLGKSLQQLATATK